jgi:hypothetical protein
VLFRSLGYALFTGLGARMIVSWFQNLKYKRIAFYVLLAIPLFYTPMMLFGFSSQLKTVQYPVSWAEVNNILKEDKNCKALFLPWQQYYSLKFNNDILTGNPARNYFDCDIMAGKNMELGDISSQGGNGEEYDEIEKVVMNNEADPNTTIEFLKQKGIKYIIFTNDAVDEDDYKYPFLGSNYAHKVMNREGVDLYSIF